MLTFFDETFRTAHTGHKLGAICGIAIPEDLLIDVGTDIFYMKLNSFGEEFARHRELKGKDLLRRRHFQPDASAFGRAAVEFVRDTLRYIVRKRLAVLGVVCFDTQLRTFKCDDPDRLDWTYRELFQRLDNYMVREFKGRRAKMIFDDSGFKTNLNRARAITNFFNRSPVGRGYDTIIRTPLFAVSQGENIGLQLADIVTTVCGMRFQGVAEARPFWRILKDALYHYQLGLTRHSTLSVIQDRA